MTVKELKRLLEDYCDENKEIKMDAEVDTYLRIDTIAYNEYEDCYILKF